MDIDIYNDIKRELNNAMRNAYLSRYAGAMLISAISIEKGSFEDLAKDINRGRISDEDALTLLKDAVRHKVITESYYDLLLKRLNIADIRNAQDERR